MCSLMTQVKVGVLLEEGAGGQWDTGGSLPHLMGANLWDCLLCHWGPEPSTPGSQYSLVGKSPCVWLGLCARWPFSATGMACFPQLLLFSVGEEMCLVTGLGLPRVAESKPGECGEQRSHLTMYTGHCPCCLWRARTGSHGVPGFPAGWAEVVWGGGGCREWKVRKAVTVLLVSAEETA